MRSITKYNARTQCIELAIEELSKRDSITMTDVREYMDNLVSQKISTGKHGKYLDPNGEEHEYEEKEPISKFYKYKSDESEIYARALAKCMKKPEVHPELVGDYKVSEALKELKKVAWNIKASSVADFTRLILQFVDYTRTGKMPQDNIYLKSVVQGNGKSFLMEKILEGAKACGISTSSASWPTGEHANLTPFCSSLLAVIEDTSPRVKNNVNVDQIKAMLRREETKMNIKYSPEVMVKGKAFCWINGNCNFPIDTRGYTTIETNSITVSDLSNIRNDILDKALDTELFVLYRVTHFSNDLMLILKNFSKNSNKNNKKTSVLGLDIRKIPEIQKLLLLIQKYRLCSIDFHRCCLNNFLSLEDENVDVREQKSYFYSRTLLYLFSKGLVSKVTSGSDLYRKWDVSKLLEIDPDSLETEEDSSMTALDEIEETQKEWDRIIKLVEDYEKNDTDPIDPTDSSDEKEHFLYEEAQEADFPLNFVYKKTEYSVPTTQHGEDIQFLVSNPVKLKYIKEVTEGKLDPSKLAQGDYLEDTNFVFECDNTSVEEQKQMIENLPEEVKKSIISVTSSGADSVHVLLETTCHVKEARKAVWKYLSDTYFGGKADQQCSNNSRLTPNPNAIRNRKITEKPQFVGKKQTCFYFNSKPEPLYVDNIVLKERQKQEELETLYETFKSDKDFYSKRELSVQTLKNRKQSQARDYAIRLLEGTIEHGPDAVSGLKYLLATGYDEADCWQNIPLDTWSKKEFQGMLDFAKKGL